MTNGEKIRTVEERIKHFNGFCTTRKCNICKCTGKGTSILRCAFEWLELEYKEELNPCPFCGGESVVISSIHEGCEYHHVECKKCHGSSIGTILADESIAAWNRRVS
jgi:Lar family restriction alleviation protein